MAEAQSGSGSTAIVAIVALVLLVAIGFFVFRGFLHRGGGAPNRGSDIQINIPRPTTTPGK